MQLVEQHESVLVVVDVIVDPDFVARHELVHVVVAALGKVDVVAAAYEPAVDEPHVYAILERFPQPLMHFGDVQWLVRGRHAPDVTGLDPHATLLGDRDAPSRFVIHPPRHQPAFSHRVPDEELLLIRHFLDIEPDLGPWDLAERVMVAEVAELLVEVLAHV